MKLTLFLVSGLLTAAAPPPLEMNGVYRYAGDDAKDSTAILEAIEGATQEMNFFLRGVARSRLKRRNRVIARAEIRHAEGEMFVALDAKQARRPSSGVAQEYVAEDGTVTQLSHTVSPDAWTQIYVGKNGTRSHRFTPMGVGGLLLSVRIESDRLPEPVVYSLPFTRIPGS